MKMSHKLKTLILTLGIAASLANASALTIDTSSTWLGNVNEGWLGSGQSLTVDATENFFVSFSVYAHSESDGKVFGVQVADALNGGNVLFSTTATMSPGLNTININQAFTPGSTIYVLFDYNGFNGMTLHFQGDVYGGGNSSFGPIGSQESWEGLDHRFIAVFSDQAAVPETSTSLLLIGMGIAGIFAFGRFAAA